MTRISVSEFDDLRHSTLSDAGCKLVFEELVERDKPICKTEEWIIRENNWDAIKPSRTLVALEAIKTETDSGYVIVPTCTRVEEVIGQSVCTIFEPHEEGIETAGGPQSSLLDLGGS